MHFNMQLLSKCDIDGAVDIILYYLDILWRHLVAAKHTNITSSFLQFMASLNKLLPPAAIPVKPVLKANTSVPATYKLQLYVSECTNVDCTYFF